MKQTITALILCIALTAVGQESEQPKETKEWAFNIILVPNRLLGGNADFQNTVNLISYKSIKENGNTLRWSFGGSYQWDSNDAPRLGVQMSLGYEKQRKISPHWITSVGFDVPLGIQAFDCSFAPIENISCSFIHAGIGGIYGVQWMINDKASLRTEGGIYYTYLFDGDNTQTINSIKFMLPRSLYLGVRF